VAPATGCHIAGGKISEPDSRRKPWPSSAPSAGPRRVRAAPGTAGLGGHQRSQPAYENCRSDGVHRYDSHGEDAWAGSNPTRPLPRRHWRHAHEVGGHRGTGLTCARAGAIAAASELRCPSPAVPQTCPKERSPAVTKGQYRSTGKVADLRHRRTSSSTTVLPKLAVTRGQVRARRTRPALQVMKPAHTVRRKP
jgi:hypothetical protein